MYPKTLLNRYANELPSSDRDALLTIIANLPEHWEGNRAGVTWAELRRDLIAERLEHIATEIRMRWPDFADGEEFWGGLQN